MNSFEIFFKYRNSLLLIEFPQVKALTERRTRQNIGTIQLLEDLRWYIRLAIYTEADLYTIIAAELEMD